MFKEMNKKLKPEYRQVKRIVPHCPICQEPLQGNNSTINPYKCSCGTWVSDWNNPFEFEIKR